MNPDVDLYIDIQSQPGRMLAGLNGGNPPQFTGFFQGQHLQLRIWPVRPSGTSIGNAFTPVPLTAFDGIKIAVGKRAGTPTPLALAGMGTSYPFAAQTTPDSDGVSGYWSGELNLNTTAMNTEIGSNDTATAWLEIVVVRSGNPRVILQQQITITAVVLDPSGAVSLPGAATEYFTKDEIRALFVPWDARNRAECSGRRIILTSPAGTATREIGVADDGSGVDNLTA